MVAKQILLVEDDVLIATVNEIQISKFGYKVIVARTGEEAVTKVEANEQIALVLMDINLGPGIDGTEAAKRILKLRHIPIIFLTSHTSEDYVRKVQEITRYGYVVKDSNEFVLRSSIEMAFQLHEAFQERTKSEEKLAAILNSFSDVVFTVDTSHRFTALYGTWMSLSGLPENFFIGKTPGEVLGEEAGRIHNEQISLAFKGESTTYEWSISWAGIVHVFETKLSTICNREGVITAAVGVGREITRRSVVSDAAAKEASEANAARFWSDGVRTVKLLQQISAGVVVHGPDTAIKDHNMLACELLGLDYDQLRGKRALDPEWRFLDEHGCSLRVDDYPVNKIIETGLVLRNRIYGVVHRDGSKKWLLVNGAPYFERSSLKEIIITFVDITENRILQKVLIETEKLFSKSFFDSPIGNGLNLPEGTWSDVNRTMCDILGYSKEELRQVSIHTITYAEDLNRSLRSRQRLSKGETAREDHETRYIRKDGLVIWVNECISLIRDDSGEPEYFLYALQDITQRKLVEEQFNRDKDQREKLLKEKEILLHEVHHRVKNNIATMASLFTLQAAAARDKTVSDELKGVVARLKSMGSLYGKLYESQDYANTSARKYLHEVAADISRLFGGNGIVIRNDIDDISMPVKSLSGLGIIMNELIVNGVKHAFPGKSAGLIHVTFRKRGDKVILEYTDNGIGMNIDEEAQGFGLQLIELLTQQLKGSLQIFVKDGTKILITMPETICHEDYAADPSLSE